MSRHSQNKAKSYSKSEKFGYDKTTLHAWNDKQSEFMNAIRDFDLVFAVGYPGTSKTLLSTYMAFEHIDSNSSSINSMVVTRNITDADGSKSIGAIPGEVEDKTRFFLEPIYDNLKNFMKPGRINALKKTTNNVVSFLPYEFIRGRSLDDTFIIVEEAQNFTASQMYSVLTRCGKRSKMVVNGDYLTQRDLPGKFGKSGLEDAINKMQKSSRVAVVNFDKVEYITRSDLVKDVILSYYG